MVARRWDNLFRIAVASTPSSPSTKATKGGEVPALLEACLQVYPLLTPFRLVQAPLWILRPVRLGVGVHDQHVVDTVCSLLPEVTDEQVALLFCDFRRQHYCVVVISACPGWRSLHPLHGAT